MKGTSCDPKYWLPRKVGAWCGRCGGFVKIKMKTITTTKTELFEVKGDMEYEFEIQHRPETKNCGFCATCGDSVDVTSLPHEAIDRLRLIAELVHAKGKS